MSRSDNIRADIERVESMPDDEFSEKWGAWAYRQDRDLDLMRQRWLNDLKTLLPYAVREDEACEELVRAKDAYRMSPTKVNQERKQLAVAAVQEIRSEYRTKGVQVIGDAFVDGV